MSDAPVARPVADGPLTDDLPCTRCGYNLRGLMLDGLCPECFTPISRSVHGNLLRYADPEWLDKLRRGAKLMLWNIAIAIIFGFVGALLGGFIGAFTGATWIPAFIQLLGLVAASLGAWAIFLITTPEPAVVYREKAITVRRVVRGSAVASLAGNGLEAGGGAGALGSAAMVLGGLMGLVGIIAHFGMFVFLRRFAERVPDERLAKQTRIVMWGFGVAMSLIAIGGVLVVLTSGAAVAATGAMGPGTAAGTTRPVVTGTVSPAGGAGLLVGGGVACIVVLGMAVFGLWYVRLLTKYHELFKTAAAQARETLAEASAAMAGEGAALE